MYFAYSLNGKYNGEVYKYCAGYQYEDKTIVGFSHTHFSGTSEAPRKAAIIEMNFVEKDQELQLQAKKESFRFLKINP